MDEQVMDLVARRNWQRLATGLLMPVAKDPPPGALILPASADVEREVALILRPGAIRLEGVDARN